MNDQETFRSIRAKMAKLEKQYKPNVCFYEDEYCSGKTISSHSISNSRLFHKIQKAGHVIGINLDMLNFNIKEERPGVNTASTFFGFCHYHDNKLFKPIDDYDYAEGDREQEFLFCFRAMAHSLAKLKKWTWVIDRLPRITMDDFQSQAGLHEVFIDNLSKFNNIQYTQLLSIFKKLKKDLEVSKFKSILTEIIKINKPISFVVSSLFNLTHDLDGRILYQSNPYILRKPVFLHAFPQGNGSFVLLSCLEEDASIFLPFFQEIKRAKNEKLCKTISNIIIRNCENVFFSPDKWDAFDEQNKQRIYQNFEEAIKNRDSLNIRDVSIDLFSL